MWVRCSDGHERSGPHSRAIDRSSQARRRRGRHVQTVQEARPRAAAWREYRIGQGPRPKQAMAPHRRLKAIAQQLQPADAAATAQEDPNLQGGFGKIAVDTSGFFTMDQQDEALEFFRGHGVSLRVSVCLFASLLCTDIVRSRLRLLVGRAERTRGRASQ